MNDRGFGKRLAQELPRWQAQGWVSAEAGILALLFDGRERYRETLF